MFGLLHNHQLTYGHREDVGGGVTAFTFRADLPLHYAAGQNGWLRLGATARKPFCLASAPQEHEIVIATSLMSGSPFKQQMAALQPDDKVWFRGPVNRFTITDLSQDPAPGPQTRHAVFLGQGVGITPLRSLLAHNAMNPHPMTTTLIHVAPEGHAYRADTERFATTAQYVTHSDRFRSATTETARTHPDATYFLAGAPQFVTATATLLRDTGVADSNIRLDKYTFFRPAQITPGAAITSETPTR